MKLPRVAIVLVILLFTNSCNENTGYVIQGKINDYDNHYLFLHYNDARDSTLVKNGQFTFKGNFSNVVPVSFATENTSATDRNLYLVNGITNVELKKETKTRGDKFFYDWLIVEKTMGSKPDMVYTNYLYFKEKNRSLPDSKKLVFSELKKIFEGSNGSGLNEQLLFDEIYDSLLYTAQLRELYQIMKDNNITNDTILDARISNLLYPDEVINVGDPIKDFLLNDTNGKLFSTEKLRGSMLLIDFWASWCKPCRQEFPELIELYEKHIGEGFEILGVSIDKSNKDWLKAIEKDRVAMGQCYYGKRSKRGSPTYL